MFIIQATDVKMFFFSFSSRSLQGGRNVSLTKYDRSRFNNRLLIINSSGAVNDSNNNRSNRSSNNNIRNLKSQTSN
jgi:hypothetical protein